MNESYPRTLMEFEDRFHTEDACQAYLVQLRWPDGFRCPRCGHGQSWSLKRKLWQCSACKTMSSATAGTIFHGSHIPLCLWFRAIWWITNQKSGVSALGLQRMLGLGSYRTAWACLHKLRRAMVRPGRDQLSGEVEVDETIVGGVEIGGGRRHLGATKALVIVAAEIKERGMGRIRIRQIPDASEDSLVGFVKQVVTQGTVVITDGWSAYPGLARIGYIHEPRVVRTSTESASTLLPRVHRVAALLKRWLLGIHQGRVSRKHLGYYLDEFTFRFNRRTSKHRGKLFYRLLQQAVAVDPVPYSELVRSKNIHKERVSAVT